MTVSINGVRQADVPALQSPPTTRFVVVPRPERLGAELRRRIEAHAHVLEAVPGGLLCRLHPHATLEGLAVATGTTPFPYSTRFKWNEATVSLPDEPETLVVTIALHRGEGRQAVIDALAALGVEVFRQGAGLVGEVNARTLPRVLALDAVRHVEPAVEAHASAPVAARILRAPTLHAAGLDGDGQVVAFIDSGFDTGDPQQVHPELSGRVVAIKPLPNCQPHDETGHGTHLATAALGTSGVAPKARLFMHAARNKSHAMLVDTKMGPLFDEARAHGARVYNCSINDAANVQSYSVWSRDLDEALNERPWLVVCVPTGNGARAGSAGTVPLGSVQAPATAKNCIAVGASENERPEITETYGKWFPADFGAPPIKDDPFADTREGLAAFSGRGPARGGRLRPDVVAPGTSILAARSSKGPPQVNTMYGSTTEPSYCFDGGTSVSSALVAAAAALVCQWLSQVRNVASPSAALVKALLINGASPLAGQYGEAGTAPNNDQGFGRVDLSGSVGDAVGFVDEAVTLDGGEEWSTEVQVPAGHGLVATLVWNDPAGEGLTNHLDLSVEHASGAFCHGNRGPGDPSIDTTNNVERVRWLDVPPGPSTLRVRASSCVLPQAFALAWRIT
ncbi:MAG: S8 family serine peptidase [Myxococcales bacterium]|nr:S8 family serine peptidase [Myxococcales bacterium]